MALGFGKNNLKASIGNFIILFGVQLVFQLDESLTYALPTPLQFFKMITSSAVATFVFYGYNKMKNTEGT